jgi:hypothetical protein
MRFSRGEALGYEDGEGIGLLLGNINEVDLIYQCYELHEKSIVNFLLEIPKPDLNFLSH